MQSLENLTEIYEKTYQRVDIQEEDNEVKRFNRAVNRLFEPSVKAAVESAIELHREREERLATPEKEVNENSLPKIRGVSRIHESGILNILNN